MQGFPQTASFDVSDIVANSARRKFEASMRRQRATATPDDCADEIAAQRMASDMLEIAGASGCATDADLILKGWTPDDIANFGESANREAIRRANEIH